PQPETLPLPAHPAPLPQARPEPALSIAERRRHRRRGDGPAEWGGGPGRVRGRAAPSPVPPLGAPLSAPFEVADQLPIGDGVVVEDALLLAGRVQQVLEHEVAEGLPSNLARG